jgi:hypothetical protein
MQKYRNEIKMNINAFDRTIISSRLKRVLPKDKHCGEKGYYKVRSLYFDDLNDTALVEKLIGVKYREKYRIRVYDSSTAVIRLEKKVKNNHHGFKESAGLTHSEGKCLLQGDYQFLKEKPEKVCKELYVKLRTGLFKPKTIVEYDREAYFWEPGRVRITIDDNLKTGLSSIDFFNFSLPLTRASDHSSILEIKYDYFLPSHISNLIQLENRQKSAISKYVLCRRYI